MFLSVTQLRPVTPSRKGFTDCKICSPLCLLTTLFCLPMKILLCLYFPLFTFFCLYLSCVFIPHLFHSLSKQLHTGAHYQPHGFWVKAAQGPLKLGRFPADIQYPKGFLEECVFVCAVNKPTNLFSFFCAASRHTCNVSGQTTACKTRKKKRERNKGQSTDSEQRHWPFKKKWSFPWKIYKAELMQTEAGMPLFARCLFSYGNTYMQRIKQ